MKCNDTSMSSFVVGATRLSSSTFATYPFQVTKFAKPNYPEDLYQAPQMLAFVSFLKCPFVKNVEISIGLQPGI